MAVFRINKTTDYSVMCNRHLKEKEMSLKAKGLLSLMLSLPDEWQYSISGIVNICKEKEDTINSTLKELKDFGYLRVDKLLPNETKTGRIEYVYNIFETPQEKQGGEKQGVEKQPLEKQGAEKPTQLNTNKSNTNKLNTNILNNTAERVLNYLNQKAGTKFKPVESNLKFIVARLKQYSESDLKAVIDKKVKEWKGTKMQAYLRPETLFNATKFESYKNGLSAGEKHFESEREYTAEEMDGLIDNVDDIKF